MALDPAPVNLVAAAGHHRIKLLPQVNIFNRRFGCSFPAPRFPAVYPFGDTFSHVFTVQVQRDVARLFKGSQCFNHGRQLHAVVGGAQLAPKDFFFNAALTEQRAPAAWARVAFAGAVGVITTGWGAVFCCGSVIFIFLNVRLLH